jgi:hypothetical protein
MENVLAIISNMQSGCMLMIKRYNMLYICHSAGKYINGINWNSIINSVCNFSYSAFLTRVGVDNIMPFSNNVVELCMVDIPHCDWSININSYTITKTLQVGSFMDIYKQFIILNTR